MEDLSISKIIYIQNLETIIFKMVNRIELLASEKEKIHKIVAGDNISNKRYK